MSVKIFFVTVLLAIAVSQPFHQGYPVDRPPGFSSLRNTSILVLHSYGPDYGWTVEVNKGIMTVLRNLDWTNTVRVEYMDSKNIFDEQYLQELAELYLTKYQIVHFDGVIVSDNNALNFIEKYGKTLFPSAAFVATGINGVDSVVPNTIASSVIIEKADHAETLGQAMRQNPEAKNAYVIYDSSTTGYALLEEVMELLPRLSADIEINIVPPMAFEELLSHVATVDADDFIYLLPYVSDETGRSFRQGYVATFLARRTSIPIYGSWQFQIGEGLVGGRVLSGFRQGEKAAQSLIALLEGKKDEPMFVEPSSSFRNLYDYNVLKLLKIPLDRLPDEVEFLHKPPSFYATHKQILIPAVLIISVLTIFLLLLLQNRIKQLNINKRDRAIIDLNREIIETQRELVTILGEVIENHSKETGNHVKRVAKISRFLGEKAGLSEEELEILEAASPLHDVGKIGVSERLLHKHRKLTEKEFERIKKHTTIGRDILQTSNRKLLASARSIAYEHHERWDGNGYPNGLKGTEIDIFARITMLADIYDALSSERSYKKAWPEDKVIEYIRCNDGIFFDPSLVAIFLEHRGEIREIRERYEPE